MKTTRKRARPAARRRRCLGNTGPVSGSQEFLRRTFYYLKGEQFLRMSNRLLCEAY